MDNTKLIAEARAKAAEPMLGKSQWRELDKSIAMIRRLADALEAAEAELTRRDTLIAETMDIEEWPYKPSQMQPYELDEATGYNQARNEFRRILAAAPVSLEAVKAETTTVFACRGSQHMMQSFGSRVAAIEHARLYGCSVQEREVGDWRPVESEGDNRG